MINDYIDIDPDICFGKPRIKGSGVTTEAVFDRFIAEEPIESLLNDYGISDRAARAAIDYEYARLSALDSLNHDLIDALRKAGDVYEMLINSIPTGPTRDAMCDERIGLQSLIDKCARDQRGPWFRTDDVENPLPRDGSIFIGYRPENSQIVLLRINSDGILVCMCGAVLHPGPDEDWSRVLKFWAPIPKFSQEMEG